MRTAIAAGAAALSLAFACVRPTPTLPPKSLPEATAAATAPVAAARTADVVETRYGIPTHDPYRWMEGNDNADVTNWLRAQGQATDAWLARIPARDALLRRVRELGLGTSGAFGAQPAGGRLFYRYIGANEQLAKLMVRGAGGNSRVLVDPAALGKDGSHASVNATSPSPDGAAIAYDLAQGGGEVSQIHVMDVRAGLDAPDVVERVWGEFPASWLPDRSGFLYTQMAPPAKDADPLLNMVVRLHIFGTSVDGDPVIIGRRAGEALAYAPEEFPSVAVDQESGWMIAFGGGAHNEARIAVAPLESLDRSGAGKTPWRKVAEYSDSIEGVWIHGDRLYLLTFKNASNRKLVSVPLAAPDLASAKVEIPESSGATIVGAAAAHDALYIQTMSNGRAGLLRMPWGGAPAPLALPYDGWIDSVAADPLRDGAIVEMQGWTKPGSIYGVDGSAFQPMGIGTTTNADFSNIAADEVEATSSDGTKVPLSILYRKDLARDGSHAAIVNGYGGYGVSETPFFQSSRLAWLERGGVYAVCHVRGGGEKGYEWQRMGTHEHKMNGVHDLEACAQYLIDNRFTSAKKVAAQGGSMGGVLIGRAITDRPDLFAAANIAVGIVNPLRILAAENGANQKTELGDPETEAGYKSLYAMDPYLHVKDGTAYPAVLFTVGLNDKRVAPWMTAKMAARMQAATTSGKPVLVRIESDAGHGIGSTRDQSLRERADVWAFILATTGDAEFQPR
jgi:prolyl oligopeptidase